VATLLELKHNITALSKKIETVGSEAVAGTKTFTDAKVEMDAMEVDLKKWQDEYLVVSRFEETKAANLAAAGGAADHNEGEKDAQIRAAEHAMFNSREKTMKSLGQQFVESAAYKNYVAGSGVRQSGAVELKTTLGEGSAAPGYAAVQTPTVLPGITSILFADLTVADLFPSGTMDGNNLRYIVETAVTNAAATVAESGTKPLSDLTLGVVDDRLRKIATLLQVTDEMLQDVSYITSYITNRMSLFVKIAEELQLLLGDGTGENLTGVMNRSGKQTTIVKGTAPSVAGDNDMDVILRQLTAVRIGSFLEPDAIVIDPASWQTIQLSKASTSGIYFAGGPFMGSAPATLWGKKVVVTPRMTAGAALVGAFGQAAQVFRKGGIVIDSSNSHSTNFALNQHTMRAEERLLLAVYRPSGFGVVTGL
jgi:HK97 family phage major capsid protein